LAHDCCRFPTCGGSCSTSTPACAYFPFSLWKLNPSLVLFYTSALLSFVFNLPSPNLKLFPLLFQFKALNCSPFQFRTQISLFSLLLFSLFWFRFSLLLLSSNSNPKPHLAFNNNNLWFDLLSFLLVSLSMFLGFLILFSLLILGFSF
jgi:hypothetical protein